MSDKKTELKRLFIFLFLAFALSWIPAFAFNRIFGYKEWFETNKYPLLFWFVGYGPALANILTRMITHEGWKDSLLHLNLKGNVKYYLIAIVFVSIASIPTGVMETLVCGNGDWSKLGTYFTPSEFLSSLFIILGVSPLIAFNTIGEEFGWRGYMNQKLEKFVGTAGTVVIGGIIWGLWHAVLTVEGHNFGTDYPGYPWLGIGMMCIICIFNGMALMWLTKKTGSIYPAAILHAMNNNGGSITSALFLSGVTEDYSITFPQMLICSIPEFAIFTIFFVLMLMDNKKKTAEAV